MNINDAFPTKYLSSNDVKAPTLAHITSCGMEDVGGGERKAILFCQELQKGLILNVTNKNTLVSLYGEETNNWTGKPVVIWAADVEYKGEMTKGLRLRAPKTAPQETSGPAPMPGPQQQGGPQGPSQKLDDDIPF